jgi:hypothetical protein
MIVADTNVISEMMRPFASENVVNWFDQFAYGAVGICAPSLAELRYGIERLPASHRKDLLEQNLSVVLRRYLAADVYAFDASAALAYGRITSRRESNGRPIGIVDAMIASICIANGATLATRNTADFAGLDLKLVNPFEAV